MAHANLELEREETGRSPGLSLAHLYYELVRRLGYWWNGSWGSMSSRKVWLHQLPDSRFELTWLGGDWVVPSGRFEFKKLREELGPPRNPGRPGRHVYTDPADVLAALGNLLGDRSGWKETLSF